MFDKLIESEPKGADFKDRRKYFMVSSVVVGIVFTAAVVVSIFAADYGLGTSNFELVEIIAPDDLAPVEPEPPTTRLQPQDSSPSTSGVPTRQVNMARVDETPTAIPDTISTTRNTQLARPDTGRFKFSTVDSDPGHPGGSGRETGTPGPGNSTLGDLVVRDDKPEPEDATPPPVIKKAAPPKTLVSKGVLNGRATDLPKPNYSAIARQVGAHGQVSVQVTIDEAGRVISANAVSGHVMLRADAERAARSARFSPTFLSDVPVKVTGVITYNFQR